MRAVISAFLRRYITLTFFAPRRIAERVASIATLPPPTTMTFLPVKSGGLPSPISRNIWMAEITPLASSPGIPSFLSVWAPIET